jgi:cytochrome c-type biogenesis protein CcmH/NrfF
MVIRRNSMRLVLLAAVFSGVGLSSGLPAFAGAQIPEGMEGAFLPHPEAEEAISQLYSPFCPGFMLENCGASIALRDSMQVLAYDGWSSDQIVDWMLSNYGEQYLAVPEARGWGLWAWVLPPAALLAGLGMVFVALKRFKPLEAEKPGPRSAAEGKGSRAISTAEEERLRSAIREIEISEDPSF